MEVMGSDGNVYPARMTGHPPALERICPHQWGRTNEGACKNCGLILPNR